MILHKNQVFNVIKVENAFHHISTHSLYYESSKQEIQYLPVAKRTER